MPVFSDLFFISYFFVKLEAGKQSVIYAASLNPQMCKRILFRRLFDSYGSSRALNEKPSAKMTLFTKKEKLGCGIRVLMFFPQLAHINFLHSADIFFRRFKGRLFYVTHSSQVPKLSSQIHFLQVSKLGVYFILFLLLFNILYFFVLHIFSDTFRCLNSYPKIVIEMGKILIS